MKMAIKSPSHGEHTVYFDDEDLDLIKQYKWGIWKSKTGRFYAFHSWKRNGEEVTIKMHRLVMKAASRKLIDHIDGDTLNNKKNNLRIVEHSQNSMNRGKTVKNKSGFKGVSKKSANRYQAVITVGGETHSGGLFNSPVDAAKKYDEMAKKYHGEFAFLNFPDKKEQTICADVIYTQEIGPRKRENSTNFRGVAKVTDSKKNKFRAYINVNGERINLGCFKTDIDAAKAYDEAARRHHGVYASLNFNQ